MSGSPDYTTTPNLGLFRPNYDMDDGTWGVHLNANADVLDSAIHALQSGTGNFLPLTGGTITGNLTVSGKLNVAALPNAQPDGSPPVGAVRGDLYINGGFLCIAR